MQKTSTVGLEDGSCLRTLTREIAVVISDLKSLKLLLICSFSFLFRALRLQLASLVDKLKDIPSRCSLHCSWLPVEVLTAELVPADVVAVSPIQLLLSFMHITSSSSEALPGLNKLRQQKVSYYATSLISIILNTQLQALANKTRSSWL